MGVIKDTTSMLPKTFKAVAVTAITVATVPYAVSVLLNIIYGWPLGRNKYWRALNPRKVLLLNWAALRTLSSIRYLPLYVRWKYFYTTASNKRITKNISFGKNGNFLDIYHPPTLQKTGAKSQRIVLVFIYGGTWSSGDKSDYCLLCSNLAVELDAVVCCPNYSIYPQGFVDDMVQDLADCLGWIHDNIDYFGGDKYKIVLIGHSAGAHLCAMTTLELIMKQLLECGKDLTHASFTRAVSGKPDPMSNITFEEEHFNKQLPPSTSVPGDSNSALLLEIPSVNIDELDSAPLSHSSISLTPSGDSGENNLQSFGSPQASMQQTEFDTSQVNLERELDTSLTIDQLLSSAQVNVQPSELDSSFCDLGTDNTLTISKQMDNVLSVSKPTVSMSLVQSTLDPPLSDSYYLVGANFKSQMNELVDISDSVIDERSGEDRGDVSRVGREALSDSRQHQALLSFRTEKESKLKTSLQRSVSSVSDITASVKLVIGLAGVYNIADHYIHEYNRGVEDVSAMARAMYGPELFDRFSPIVIMQNFPKETRIPPFLLIHGENDKTVPVNSSRKMLNALMDRGADNSRLVIVRNCNHVDVCLDLMNDKSKYYHELINIIQSSIRMHV